MDEQESAIVNEIKAAFERVQAETVFALVQTTEVLHAVGLHPSPDWRKCPMARCVHNTLLLERQRSDEWWKSENESVPPPPMVH